MCKHTSLPVGSLLRKCSKNILPPPEFAICLQQELRKTFGVQICTFQSRHCRKSYLFGPSIDRVSGDDIPALSSTAIGVSMCDLVGVWRVAGDFKDAEETKIVEFAVFKEGLIVCLLHLAHVYGASRRKNMVLAQT